MMKSMNAFVAAVVAFFTRTHAQVQGFDISHWQESVDFGAAYASGARFVIIKATEGVTYTDPKFSTYHAAATDAGLVRGAYHYGRPGENPAADQADHFLANGGQWKDDGITLPGMLDLEAGCWNLTSSAMVEWIKAFSDHYSSKTGRTPMLYTNPSWWKSCAGNSAAFSTTNPLVLARWSSSPGEMIGGWAKQTIWQYNDHYEHGGDSDQFNGSEDELRAFAKGEKV